MVSHPSLMLSLVEPSSTTFQNVPFNRFPNCKSSPRPLTNCSETSLLLVMHPAVRKICIQLTMTLTDIAAFEPPFL